MKKKSNINDTKTTLKAKEKIPKEQFKINVENQMREISSSATKACGKYVKVKFNSGYNNDLYVRGEGGELSWDKGIPLINIKNDEWVWPVQQSLDIKEFKILINDKKYENGTNRKFDKNTLEKEITPNFD